ncbi:integration host factor subunit beta [Arsenophonus symbiont of Ornithomya chloropus]|uniref:integration host factor subunit beta n=1 Tax=Arsenophonus symbiont of Ornithomya chloropus TaxID=634121 RepID=UPI0032B11C83
MTKSELIERLINELTHMPAKLIEKTIKLMIENMIITLSKGKRIEIRGFGSFSLHYRASRIGRNPKNGHRILLKEKVVPHFKPGKELRDRVNNIYA